MACQWVPDPERPAEWKEEIAAAFEVLKQENPNVFDDALAALQSFEANGTLALSFSKSFYSAMAITHSHRTPEFLHRYGPQGLSKGTACALALQSPDGFLFGRRSPKVHQGVGLWHPVAGHFNWKIHLKPDGDPDPFACILEELEEETGLEACDLNQILMVGVMAHPKTQKPELLFFAQTALGKTAIEEKIHQAKDKHEMDDLGFFSATEMKNLSKSGELGPDKPATLVSQALATTLSALDLLA